MIRILHVIGIMNRGGAETMIMNLYRHIDRSKIQFDFVENSFEPAVFDDEILSLGGRIYRCPHYNGKNHFVYTKWWNTFFAEHRGEYPIVHGHLGSTAAIYLSIAKKYGAYAIAHSHNTKGNWLYQAFTWPTRFVADYFFACSQEAGISRFGRKTGTNKAKCMVWPNAIDTDRYAYHEEERKKTRNELGISEEQLVLGNISRFSEQKNHLFLIDVFEAVHRQRPDSVLLLVGDGALRPKIEAHIAQKGLQDHVILTGVQSDTWKYYQAMDAFVMPSLYEGLPVSMVEAQAAGLRCFVSDAVPKESALTNLVGFKPLGDGAEQWGSWILEHPQAVRRSMKKEIGKAGYDIDASAKKLEQYYTEVVNQRGGAH